jgi:hypothetical protein
VTSAGADQRVALTPRAGSRGEWPGFCLSLSDLTRFISADLPKDTYITAATPAAVRASLSLHPSAPPSLAKEVGRRSPHVDAGRDLPGTSSKRLQRRSTGPRGQGKLPKGHVKRPSSAWMPARQGRGSLQSVRTRRIGSPANLGTFPFSSVSWEPLLTDAASVAAGFIAERLTVGDPRCARDLSSIRLTKAEKHADRKADCVSKPVKMPRKVNRGSR